MLLWRPAYYWSEVTVKIVRFLLTATLGGFIGLIVGLLFPRNDPYVHVLVTNNASVPVQTIRLESKDGGIYLLETLAVGATQPIIVYAAGESSYSLKVIFSNGKTLQGGAGYVEPGYKVAERITDEKIESDYDLKGAY